MLTFCRNCECEFDLEAESYPWCSEECERNDPSKMGYEEQEEEQDYDPIEDSEWESHYGEGYNWDDDEFGGWL